MATSTYPPKLNEGVLQFSVFLSFFVLFISVWHFTCRITIVHSEEQKKLHSFSMCALCINKNINLYILK